jgi:hypothetical protein
MLTKTVGSGQHGVDRVGPFQGLCHKAQRRRTQSGKRLKWSWNKQGFAERFIVSQALGEHTYAAVWSSLRSWLLALFNKCRGVVFPNFARITWRRVGDQLEDGVPMLRPIFVPSDAYLRAHLLHTGQGVTHANGVEVADLEPCEEYSAMKIAIKYVRKRATSCVHSSVRWQQSRTSSVT